MYFNFKFYKTLVSKVQTRILAIARLTSTKHWETSRRTGWQIGL